MGGNGWRKGEDVDGRKSAAVEQRHRSTGTTAEAEKLDVAIALNIEANGIEIGQGLSFLVFFPVVRVPPEKDVGAGSVIRDIEGAEHGHLLLGRMRGENGDLIEEAFESRDRSGKGDDYIVSRRRLDDDLAIAGAERIAGGGVELRIH